MSLRSSRYSTNSNSRKDQQQVGILTWLLLISAKCVVLFPGAAHISRISSVGLAFTTHPQTIEGRFCNSISPFGYNVSFTTGSLDAGSSVWMAIPLKHKEP